MLKQEDIPKYLLSKEYVLEHGMPDDELVDEYYIDDNDVYQYGQWLDKPLDEGGKPYNGVAYLLTNDGEYRGYQEYKNGYPYGVGVSFYPESGRMADFTYENTEEHTEEYTYYKWREDGSLQRTVAEYIKCVPGYSIEKEYDESGRLVKEKISLRPVQFVNYDFDHPNPDFEVQLHENDDIRLVRKLSPSHYNFISEIELNKEGRLIRFALNPHYNPQYSTREHDVEYNHIKTFDVNFREQGGVIQYQHPDAGWLSHDGYLCFLHRDGWIEKIMEYKRGRQHGKQRLYYADGKLREEYLINDHGQEVGEHFWWYPNGVLKKAVIYSPNRKHKRTFELDASGNVISEYEERI